MNDAIISFDGNCDPNPGSGGSGSLIGINGKWYGISTNCSMTTNNREEIKGLIEGIKFLIDKKITGNSLIVIGDSEYVLNSCCHWIWKSQNKKNQKARKNLDLFNEFKILLKKLNFIKVEFFWVKGHSNFEINEMADALAESKVNSFRELDFLIEEIDMSFCKKIGVINLSS